MHHTFRSTKFSKPTSCHYCSKLIWGLSSEVSICTRCGFVCHVKCSPLPAPTCRKASDIIMVASILFVRIEYVEGNLPTDSEIYVQVSFQNQVARTKPCFGQNITSAFRETILLFVLKNDQQSTKSSSASRRNWSQDLEFTVFEKDYKQDVALGELSISNISELCGKARLELQLRLPKSDQPANLVLYCVAEQRHIIPPNPKNREVAPAIDNSLMMKKSASATQIGSPAVKRRANGKETQEDYADYVFTDHFGQPIAQPYIDRYLSFFDYWFTEKRPTQEAYYEQRFVDRLNLHMPITKELIGYCRSGISFHHRGELWMKLSGAKKKMQSNPRVYSSLVAAEKNSVVMEQVDSDIPRTFADNPLVTTAMQNKLRRLLGAYSVYDKHTGYCQALNFIGLFLLFILDEEEAFWLLVTLIEQYLPHYFDANLVGSKADLQILEKLITASFPDVGDIFLRMGMPIAVRMAPWLMCMFIGVLPTETTMRVIDWMIVEGSHVMFSVALALVELNRESLTAAKSFEEAFTVLNNMTEAAFDADTLIETAYTKFSLSKTDIAQLRTDVQGQIREKAREDLLKETAFDEREFELLLNEFHNSTNHANVIDLANFTALSARIFPQLPASVVPQLFAALDRQGYGTLTVKEFMLGVAALSKGSLEKKARLCFACFDKDRSRTLNQQELQEMFSLLLSFFHDGKQVDSEWISQLFVGTNALTVDEFVDACRNFPPLSELLMFTQTFSPHL